MAAPLSSAAAQARRAALFRAILGPEKGFYWLAVFYATASSVLTLAVPLSVQVLIGTVSNTALLRPVLVLAVVLFVLLALYGLLYAAQTHLMDRFQRRFFARFTQDIVLRSVHSSAAGTEPLNREELANRFFEVVTVQRDVPTLVLEGSATALQAMVGIAVVSAYHPAFVVFSALLLFTGWLVWKIWSAGAIRSKVLASKAKFKVAHWLEELGRVHGSFQSQQTIRYATAEAETVIVDYLDAHRDHFGFKQSQVIGYFALYALASSALLGVGGWLVISAQLTLGQLVAAELIFSTVFLSIAKLPSLLDRFYELSAAMDKLGEFLELPLETPIGGELPAAAPSGLHFIEVESAMSGHSIRFNFSIPAGARVSITATEAQQRAVVDLVLRRRSPTHGHVKLGNANLADLHLHALRDAVVWIDDVCPLERSIADNCSLGDPAITRSVIREMLSRTGLEPVIDRLPDGLDTELSRTGYPLSPEQMLTLQLAAALLRKPQVLMVSSVINRLPDDAQQALLATMAETPSLTFIRFDRYAGSGAHGASGEAEMQIRPLGLQSPLPTGQSAKPTASRTW